MLEFASPLWLLGLPAIVAIWWLHRLRADPATVSVSSLFLWQALKRSRVAGQHVQESVDPIWLLRALITTLIILALAQPFWTQSRSRIIVWFDTSLSMRAIEADQPRWRSATRNVVGQLADVGARDIWIRSLGHPGAVLALTGRQSEQWPGMIDRWFLQQSPAEPVWPATIEMDPAARHWLVSDGASEGTPDWVASAPVTRILHVGATTDNVAVKRLAVRPSLADADRWQGFVAVANMGDQPADREMLLTVDDQRHSRWSLHLSPGQTLEREFQIDAAENAIQVYLSPADALAEDDRLVLPAQRIATARYSVRGQCGPGLQRALAAHPRLQNVADQPDLTIVCGESRLPVAGPALLVHTSGQTVPVTGAPQWTAKAGALRDLFLQQDWLVLAQTEFIGFSGEPLLKLGNKVVIRFQPGPDPTLEVLLDMEHPALTARPEYPVLVGGLVDAVLQRALLDPVVDVERDLAASRIRPRQMTVPVPGQATSQRRISVAVQPYLLTLTVVLLLVDALVMVMRGRGGVRRVARSAGVA